MDKENRKLNKKEIEMYDLITSVVLYKSNYSDIEKYITQYFEKNINQKLVFVDNSEEDKIRGYIYDIVWINHNGRFKRSDIL